MAVGRITNKTKSGDSPAKIWGAVIGAAVGLYNGYKSRKQQKKQMRSF